MDGSKPRYLVNPKIAGKWMFIPLKMVLIGIDPYPSMDNMLIPCRRTCFQEEAASNLKRAQNAETQPERPGGGEDWSSQI